jgi:Family of unknown function (DUF6263)
MKKIISLAFVFIAITGFAQKTSNKLSFQKGQKLEVVTEANKNSSVELMGQSMETKVNSILTETLDVQDANNTGATVEHKVKHLKFDLTSPMQNQSFDSEKDADSGDMGKLLGKSLKNKYTMTLDPSGKITAVKSNADNPNDKNKDTADMSDLILSQLGMSIGLPRTGEASVFKILPEKEVSVGDSWTDSSSAEGQTKKTTYSVKSITANDIVLDYAEQLDINTKQQIMGMEATIITNDKSTGTITLDKASGLLKQKTIAMEEEGSMEAQGQKIPMKGKTNVTVTIRPAQ